MAKYKSSGGGPAISSGANSVTVDASRTTVVGPFAIDPTSSLSAVGLQVSGDPNTCMGQIVGADSISLVAAGREHMRVTDGYCGFLLGATTSHSVKVFYLCNAGNGVGDDVSLVFSPAAAGFSGNPCGIDGMYLGSGNGYELRFFTANDAGTRAERMRFTGKGSVVLNTAAVLATATDGFLYIAGGAGAPSGVPTAFAGRYPLYWDTTNKKFYVYDGAWLGGTAPGVWS